MKCSELVNYDNKDGSGSYPDAKNGDNSRDGRSWTRKGLGNKEIKKEEVLNHPIGKKTCFYQGCSIKANLQHRQLDWASEDI